VAEEMVFDDVSPAEVPVVIGSARYVLREANEDAACKFRNALLRCTRPGPDGRPTTYDGVADTEPLLVSLCLYAADEGGRVRPDRDGRPDHRHLVPLATVRSWPARVVKALAAKVQEMSGLSEAPATAGPEASAGPGQNGEGDHAKNLPGATTTT
jgi:hypothetical protein